MSVYRENFYSGPDPDEVRRHEAAAAADRRAYVIPRGTELKVGPDGEPVFVSKLPGYDQGTQTINGISVEQFDARGLLGR